MPLLWVYLNSTSYAGTILSQLLLRFLIIQETFDNRTKIVDVLDVEKDNESEREGETDNQSDPQILKVRHKVRSLTQNSNFFSFYLWLMKTHNLICKIVELASTNTGVHTKEKEYVVPCNGEKIFIFTCMKKYTRQVPKINVKFKWCIEKY